MNDINDFSVGGKNSRSSQAASAFEAMYDHSSDTVLHGTGEEDFDAVKMLRAADPGKYQPASGANYPRGRFGDSLRQLAQLIKANLGVQVAFADIGGWITTSTKDLWMASFQRPAGFLAIAGRILD